MEFNITINQAALQRWIQQEQIDADDGVIVAFIRSLHPDDPVVKQYMHGDYYRLTLSWVLREMPILRFTEDRLSRRLHALKAAGIVDLLRLVDEKKQFKLYGRLSSDYYRAERKAMERVDEIQKATMGENTHGSSARTPAVKTPIDHKKDDHKREDAAPLGGSGASPTLNQNSDPPLEPWQEPTQTIPEMIEDVRTNLFKQPPRKEEHHAHRN
jgi:hypothetical protein